jgi:hypothetical protein
MELPPLLSQPQTCFVSAAAQQLPRATAGLLWVMAGGAFVGSWRRIALAHCLQGDGVQCEHWQMQQLWRTSAERGLVCVGGIGFGGGGGDGSCGGSSNGYCCGCYATMLSISLKQRYRVCLPNFPCSLARFIAAQLQVLMCAADTSELTFNDIGICKK